MHIKTLLTIFIFAVSLCVMAIQDAEAARLGGGRSFGSRPSMQRSPTAPAQQRPPVANAAGQTAQKPGLFGGMGGMMGGLLAGTLLGSLLFGGPFQGGGFLDILLIALLAFLAFKLFARFRAGSAASAAGAGGGTMRYQAPQQPTYPQQGGGSAWDHLRDSQPRQTAAAPSVPAGFDTDDFLRGAKMAYTRLQSSWDKRDLDDIAQFSTPAVMQEIRAQNEQDPRPGHTEILLVNAQLLSVQNEGDTQTASVFFDVLLREEAGRDATQSREVWHFVRPVSGSDSWRLDGIQQVE